MTGNFVGESLSTTRAHQGDLRLDWNASPNDKLFLRFSIAELETKTDKQAFELLLPTRSKSPFRNLAVNSSHVFGPSLVNELLVGYNSVLFKNELNDWGGIGNANAAFGIAGDQPIAGLSSLELGNGLTNIGARATVEDSLPKIYQLNEKLTWLRGRHALKFGGQFLRYNTKRFYPGNNGLLGFFNYSGTFTGAAFSDFLLDQVTRQGPRFEQRPLDPQPEPDLDLRPGRLQAASQPDPQPRSALGLHVPGRGEGQPAGEHRPQHGRADRGQGRQHRGPRALQALLQGLRAAPRLRLEREQPPRPPRRLRHLAVHGRHRLQPAPAPQPAVLLRIRRAVQPDDRPGHDHDGLHRPPGARPGRRPAPCVGPEPPAAVHAAVEPVRGVPRDFGHVRPGRLRRPSRHPSRHARRGQPAAARHRRPLDVGSARHAPAALPGPAAGHEHLHDGLARPQQLQRAPGQPPPA